MTDKEIIKALECCLGGKEELCKECPFNGECYGDVEYLIAYALGLINRQQEQLEAAANGQETLQKALAEKNAEIERRKNNLFCKVVIDEEKMQNIIKEKVIGFELNIELIKSEAIKEFAERLKEKIKTECNPYGKRTFDYDTSLAIMRYIDNLVKNITEVDE